MKHFLLTLLFLISGVHLQAFNLARESWTENTPKTGSVVLESSNLVLRSLDGKYGACIYHKRFPTQPGRAYRLTVKASGNGVLEAGLYLYGTEKGFLGRVPLPMKAVHFRSSEPHTTVYFLEIPPGKYNGKEVPAFFRPCLRVPTGELRLLDASLEETAPLPKAMNHLDESHSVKGEQLPFFSEPNLLNSSYETWDCRGGDAIYTEKGFLLSTRNEFSTAMAVSPPIRVQQGKKYLLTGLYHTGDAAYGSFGSIRILPVGQVGKYRQNPDVQLFSSFQGRELYNREPGEWIRLSLSYTPPADVKEVCVAVIQNGAPCHVNWSSFYFGLGPWEKDSRNRAYDWKRYVNTYDPLFEMEKVREILLKREPAKLEVRNSSSPGLFLNGHSLPPLIYFGDFNRPERSKLQDFQKAGVNLQIIVLGRGQNIWRGNGDYNFAGMDELIWSNVRRNPAGTFLVLLDCSPYQKWALEFPGEVALDHAGKPAVSRHGRKGVPCYWSPLYRRQVAEFIHKAVTHMRGQLYFRAIGGFFLSGNEDGQFYYQIVRDGLLEDGNSPGALPEFRRWLRARYGSVQKLQRAWNKPGVRFETAVPPVPKRIQGNFFDPATEMPQIDLTRFLNESMGDFANLMCRTAKTAAGKPVVAIMWWGRGGSMMVYPHYAQTAKIFPSRDLDLMGAQPGYQGERNAACSNFFSWIPDSARLHGKITMIEADFRTWTSPVNSLLHDYRVARFWNHGELRSALLRDFGRQISVGGGMWFYDMTAGWFKDPVIMDDIAKMAAIGTKFSARGGKYTPGEIVFVTDEDNYYVTTEQLCVWNGPNYHTVRKNQRAMLRSGLKYDFYYFQDILEQEMDHYKIYVFLNAFHLTTEKRDFIERKLKKNGKTLIWLYAPGYLTNQGFSLPAMRRLTGIRIDEAHCALKDSIYLASPLGKNLAGRRVGMENTLGGVSFCVKDESAVPLTRYCYGQKEISGAMRDFKDWRSIYLAMPVAFTPEFLQNLAVFAGIPVYNTPGDMFLFHRDDLLCLHGVEGNTNRIHLPFQAVLRDLMTGEEFRAESGSFIIKLQPAETRLLEIRR